MIDQVCSCEESSQWVWGIKSVCLEDQVSEVCGIKSVGLGGSNQLVLGIKIVGLWDQVIGFVGSSQWVWVIESLGLGNRVSDESQCSLLSVGMNSYPGLLLSQLYHCILQRELVASFCFHSH